MRIRIPSSESLNTPPDPPDEPPPPAPKWWPLNKLAWTIVALVTAAIIFLVGMFSSSNCKDLAGNPPACRSGSGHSGSSSSSFGGGSHAGTTRGGFGGTGDAHFGGGG